MKDRNKQLITDVRKFPRSEYRARFEGTTFCVMDAPEFWGGYHRSESSRSFQVAKGRKNTQFESPCVKKGRGVHSFFAHVGGYHSPFTIPTYNDAILLEEVIKIGKVNVRDHLLLYKNKMAKIIVESFEELEDNEQKIKKKGCSKQFDLRPIIYTENNYPCILVSLPSLNTLETKTEAAKYWAAHPKPFQKLLLSGLIAFLDVEAMKANIPIEAVLRASFGHNLPSVCETDNTFRINIGVIPACYAELIATALHKLNEEISRLTDETSRKRVWSKAFLQKIKKYNASKLESAILSKELYKALIKTRDFKNINKSEKSYDAVYAEFKRMNALTNTKVGKAVFFPVDVDDCSIWEVIRSYGDSAGKSVLYECFREHGTVDWFIDQIINALLDKSESPIEDALSKLLDLMVYDETASMDYAKIHKELKSEKRCFKKPSFKDLYEEDEAFSEITNILCKALQIDRPDQGLYAAVEKGGIDMLTHYRGSKEIESDPDYGSDSEFSVDLDNDDNDHLSHIKVRVVAGMKAIVLAQYTALAFLRANKIVSYALDVDQMYYETEQALTQVNVSEVKLNNVRKNIDNKILHFDLNHCNASNSANDQTLAEKIESFSPSIIILDYTSSTMKEIEDALSQCLLSNNVDFVILVDSGLKNNQGGLDFNPYGEVRICARDRDEADAIFELMKAGLSEADKLTQESHEMVRVCKRRGLAVSLKGLFTENKPRFHVVDEESDQSNECRLG